MSEAQNYAGKIVAVAPPERSANGQNWKTALVEVNQEGAQYTKKFRVWPYEQGSEEYTPAYAAALANLNQDVTVAFTEGGYQGTKGWIKQNEVIAISGPNSTTTVNAEPPAQDWPSTSSQPPTEGALGVAEGAVLDAQAALTTAINAIRSAAKVSAEF